MSEAIDALREAYVEQRELADDLAVQLYEFERMSVLDFMFYAFGRFLNGATPQDTTEE